MNIWNKVLVGLIIVLLLPLFYFGLVALKTHQHWRSVANKLEAGAKTFEETDIPRLKYGDSQDPNLPSLQSVRIEIYKYMVNRGRVWRNCVFQTADPKKAEYPVTITKPSRPEAAADKEKPQPPDIAVNNIVLVFDEAAVKDGGCFLGEFKVNQVNEVKAANPTDPQKLQITLVPTMRLQPRAAARLATGKGSWTICELMPNDSHEVFTHMTKEQLQAALPAAVVEEYLADGQEGKTRKLRDYAVLLKELDRQETVLLEECETAKRHKEYMEAASDDAKKQQLFHQDERTALMAELKKAKDERAAALAHQQSLEKELTELKAKIAQLIKDNRATAEEIGKLQAEMVRQVDRRTAAVAQ